MQAFVAKPAPQVLHDLWTTALLPSTALSDITLPARGPVLPSSFAVATAAQASLGAAALAAAQIGLRRGGPAQRVTVDAEHVALDSQAWFTVDGQAPVLWDKVSGLYACADGWVRIHANFAHHRDGALHLLGLPSGPQTEAVDVTQALRAWSAVDFETRAAQAGLVATAARSFAQWDAHAQAAALATQPVVSIERIGDAPPRAQAAWREGDQPLTGLRVLDLTRILAGPVAGRTLAAYGADVMLVNSPHLPNISAIADTSRGKLSAHVDLGTEAGGETLRGLVRQAHVFLQGYRPGGIAARALHRQTWRACHPASCASACRPMDPQGRGLTGGASTHWCKPPPALTLQKPKPLAKPNPGPCRCKYWTTPPATCWPLARRLRCCAKPMKVAVGTCRSRWPGWATGCAAWGAWKRRAAWRCGPLHETLMWNKLTAALAACRCCATRRNSASRRPASTGRPCHQDHTRHAGPDALLMRC
jgi:crotonobetainyl-CoA:carnitine CoA-transferase CaiB-like acyl-CoA transferase